MSLRIRSTVLQVGALSGLVLSLLVAFGPGLMTPDSLTICDQSLSGRTTDWHTAVLTWVWGLSGLPVIVVFLGQTVIAVASVQLILRLWLKPWAAIGWTWLVVWFPAALGWFGVVGKDEWFAAALLASIAAMGWAARAEGRRRRTLLVLAVAAVWWAVAARPNAIVPVAAMLLVAWPTRVGSTVPAKRWAAHAGIVVTICLGVMLSQTALTEGVIRPEHKHPGQVMLQNDLAGMSLRTGTMLLPRSSLRTGADLRDLDEYFDYRRPTDIYWSPDTPLVMGSDNYPALRKAWVDAVREHPVVYLRHRLRMAAGVLGLDGPHPLGTAVEGGGRAEDFGIACPVSGPTAPWVQQRVLSALSRIERTGVWRAWTWLVLLVVAATVAGLRRNREARALLAAGSISLLSVAAGAGSITFRYAWVTVLCALVALGLAAGRLPSWRRPDLGAGSLPSAGDNDTDDAEAGDPDPVPQRGADPSGDPRSAPH